MQCAHCQHDNSSTARFCEECGQRLQMACPACGFAMAPAAKFCAECGQRLDTAAPPVQAAETFPAPQAYTPGYLAEKILTSRHALEGERKQVTVLFADIKGSTELIEGLDPEEARRLLDPALHVMMDAVHRFEGTVNQVLGDGIMALFGAPIAHEDHALRACYAALAMQAAMQSYADDVRRTHGLALRIRVGLNSGEVVVRAIGNDLHMDYSAVGQTTHLAARMEQLAAPGSIMLAAPTLRLVEGFVRVNALGLIPVKGLTEPVEVLELLGAGAVRRRLQATAARGLTRFVGRDTEIETLQPGSRGLAPGTARWWRASGRLAWASRVWCTRWCTPTALGTGWSWRALRCPTARPPPISRSSICSSATSMWRITTTPARCGSIWASTEPSSGPRWTSAAFIRSTTARSPWPEGARNPQMPHMTGKPYAVVSCHVERPLDDDCWQRFSRLQERRPGGFAIAALLRPPDADAGEDAELWLGRARKAASRGPLGHHTHFVGPTHARPAAGGAEHAERVRREAFWLREHGLEPRFFCGGGWYMDDAWPPCWPSSATRIARGRRSFRGISTRARRASPP